MRISKNQYQKLDERLGSEVEVYCASEDVWYKAILESKRSHFFGLGVRLLKNDSPTSIRSKDDDAIRPVPPAHLQAPIHIKEGCVVDADQSNGWWIGLVIKEVEEDKFLVFFKSPPDVMLFQRKHLRPHLDWVWKKFWVRAAAETQLFRRLTEESIFSSGTMVEVSCQTNNMETVLFPAMFIKEIEEEDGVKKCIVKFCNKPPSSVKGTKANVTVDLESVRPTPPPSSVEQYDLLDSVEAFRTSKWRKGEVRRIISKKLYLVYFEATKKQLKFCGSDLRTPMEWEDGVWKKRESPLAEVAEDSYTSSIANEDVSPVTLSPVISSTPLKHTEAETQGQELPRKILQPTRNEKGLGNDSTQGKGELEKEMSPFTANESVSLVTPSPVTNATPLKQRQADSESQGHALSEKTLQPTRKPSPVITATPLKQREAESQGQALPKKTLQPTRKPSPVINATPVIQREAESQGQALPKKKLVPTRNGLGNGSTQEKGKLEKETPSNGKTKKSVTLETGNVQPKEQPLAQRSGDRMANSVMKANESFSTVTRPRVLNSTPLKQAVTVTQRKAIPKKTSQPMRNQNGLANGSARENKSSQDNSRKRKREETVAENKGKDSTVVLPFEKKLPIWKTVESMEVFRTMPQSPHFGPLVETRESSREMSAVGMMLTFSGLIEEVKHLQPFSPKSTLESLKDSFVELEKYGFDVKEPQSRIHKLFGLRVGQAKKMDELQGVEVKIGEKESKKAEIEEKILELQREKDEAEKEIDQMKSCAVRIGQELEDMELQFQTTVSAQW